MGQVNWLKKFIPGLKVIDDINEPLRLYRDNNPAWAEFKRWLKQFDADGDGRISRRELREAIRRLGACFASVKAWCAVRRADRDRNGFVDDCEMESLVEFAEDELGFLISKEPTTPDGRNHCRW
ncbi:probable calcium-binding protein CML17 [Miscanthus floridulus]|uniref:probable calcium-binding protein CML17 n=1 Tax=Miscanthus floridulus TaxID=154761 RepID=UPI0034585E82